MDVPPGMVVALNNHRDEILSIQGVLGVDIGFTEPGGTPTSEIAICVLVADRNNVPAGIPETLDGYPVAVIQRDVQLYQDVARYDPVQGGVSTARGTGLSADGTLGGIARDARTGELRGLSCRHVFCQVPFQVGDDIQQPQPPATGPKVANHLGTLLRWSQFTAGALPPNLPTGTSDAAICTIERTAAATVVDIGPVNGTAIARGPNGVFTLGDRVSKRGKTTLLTHGTVSHVHRAIFVSQMSWWLLDQFEIQVDSLQSAIWSAPGDSGSLVIKEDTKEVVGLLWGGTTDHMFGYASDIDNVATDLGISLFWPIPQVSSISPAQGQEGDDVTITGIGFQLASAVTFGGASATFSRQVNSDTEIIASVPKGTGTVDVLVTAPGGTSGQFSQSAFTYVTP